MHHSSTSTYIPHFIEIEETWTDGHFLHMLLGRLGGVDLKKRSPITSAQRARQSPNNQQELSNCSDHGRPWLKSRPEFKTEKVAKTEHFHAAWREL